MESLETLFAHQVHNRLLRKGKISKEVIKPTLSWKDFVFNVHRGPGIPPDDDDVMENLARYIIRASFSQERPTDVPNESKVIYQSKKETTLDAMECLAAMFSHCPAQGRINGCAELLNTSANRAFLGPAQNSSIRYVVCRARRWRG
jgi:hypothetical protein